MIQVDTGSGMRRVLRRLEGENRHFAHAGQIRKNLPYFCIKLLIIANKITRFIHSLAIIVKKFNTSAKNFIWLSLSLAVIMSNRS